MRPDPLRGPAGARAVMSGRSDTRLIDRRRLASERPRRLVAMHEPSSPVPKRSRSETLSVATTGFDYRKFCERTKRATAAPASTMSSTGPLAKLKGTLARVVSLCAQPVPAHRQPSHPQAHPASQQRSPRRSLVHQS